MNISLYNIGSFRNTISVLNGGKRDQGGQNASSALPMGRAIASSINENIAPASIYTPPNLNELDQLSKSMLEAHQKQLETEKNKENGDVGTDKAENPLNTPLSSLKTLLSATRGAEPLPLTKPSSDFPLATESKKALNSYQSASLDYTNTARKGSLVNISV